MKYVIPPAPVDPKHRYVRVTDPAEIAACIRNELKDPDGQEIGGEWFATLGSLRKFRGEQQEIEV
jgi:hypothetical protein